MGAEFEYDVEKKTRSRPSPLSAEQSRACADYMDSMCDWMDQKSTEWGVSISMVVHALGLHNTEHWAKSLWNMHEECFYKEDTHRPDGEWSLNV